MRPICVPHVLRRRTFFTIFCSSTKKARTMRSRTAPPLSTPPYARCTVFLLLESRALLYCAGRKRGTCDGRGGGAHGQVVQGNKRRQELGKIERP